MPKLRRHIAVIAIVLSLMSVTTNAMGSGSITSDVVMSIIPVTGIAMAYFKDDDEGVKQWFRNTIANQTLTSIARLGFNETSWGERPNGHPYGFPSGHVAFAASGASFLQERYGWQYGVPAWLATGAVAWLRVDHDHHHWRDVIAAGALSYGVGKLFVTPEKATYLAPVIGPKFIGMRWERSF